MKRYPARHGALVTSEPLRLERSRPGHPAEEPLDIDGRWYRGLVVTNSNETPPTVTVEGLVARPGDYRRARLEALASPAPSAIAGYEGAAVQIERLLDEVVPSEAATHMSVESGDGGYRASIPIGELREHGWLMVGSGPGGLEKSRGGPFRLLVPDGATLCWNVKDVARMRATDGPEPDSVPVEPPH